jgi:pantetheine-phosphate adenylyltransferase
MTVGLYAGSFDPPHLGHMSIIERGAGWCSTLYVAAAGNSRKGDCLFDHAERRQLLEASTSHLDNVVALQHRGLIALLAAELHVDVLIRGIGKEQGQEFEMAVANHYLAGIPTVFLPPDPSTRPIASRTVRTDYLLGGVGAVATMVPPPVLAALTSRDPASV